MIRLKTKMTGLSGNELFCMNLKGYSPVSIVIGNSVRSMGFMGGLSAAFRGIVGGEIHEITEIIHDGRQAAYERMVHEIKRDGAHGVAGVTSELKDVAGNTEYIFVGSSVVHSEDSREFTSAGNAQELYCHMDAGYIPKQYVFGNVAYSVGAVGGIVGGIKTMARGEIAEFSNIFNKTRHLALDRIVAEAKRTRSNAVVGIRTNVINFNGANEMLMAGTSAMNIALPPDSYNNPVTSDLTGEELWAMTSMGYAPIKLLMSTAVYSLGIVGSWKSMFQGFAKGELNDLTTMVYDAREHVFDRLNAEAAEVGADQVVGIKSYIFEISSGLIEFVAIGTAVKKAPKVKVLTETLPAQAIVRDQDTWIDGDNQFDLESSARGGGH